MRSRAVRWGFGEAWVAVLSVVLASCVLLVSPATGSTTCQFTGAASSCGSCVAAACQDQVNACCGDPSCSALADLEACASTRSSACTSLQSGAETGNAGSALATCISQSCRGDCQSLTGHGTTSCSEPPFAQATACTCQLPDSDDPANDFVCSAASYPDTLCCAPEGWPGPGLQCTCNALGCSPSEGGCECMLVSYVPTGQVCQTPHCCAYLDTCSCRATDCYTYETPVESCTVAAVACPTGEHQVTSCSIASP